jgi:hypothetical protein
LRSARLGRLRLPGAIGVAGLALAVGCAARALQAPPQEPPLGGENGLFVTWADDTLRVSWITPDNGAGWAQLTPRGGTPGPELTTPAGSSHTIRVPHPGTGTVQIGYGSRDDARARYRTTVRFPLAQPRPLVTFSAVDSLYVMGDIHGELDTLKAVLRNARLIDAAGSWTGSRSHLVVAGDMMDRGADVTALLWFLYQLEPQVQQAGGRLHVILGNHEVMVMQNDLRYVHAKEMALARLLGVPYNRLFDPTRSVLGAWLVSKPAVIRIGGVLIAHGGVSTDYLSYTPQSLDDSLAVWTHEELFHRWTDSTFITPPALDSAGLARRDRFLRDERGPLWYRGFADSDTLLAQVDSVLQRFGASLHVIGHTPGPTIRAGYGGKVMMVNTVPFAAEMLLLVRRGDVYERLRIKSTGRAGPSSR